MEVKHGFLLKEVCGHSFLIPTGEANIDLSKLISLNESSLIMWQRMTKGPFTIDDLVDALLQEYDTTPEQVRPDVEAIVKEFISEGVIKDS